jgi:myosin-7
MTLKKKSKINGLEPISEKSSNDISTMSSNGAQRSYNALFENRPTSNLDKLHFIIGHGILREDLR